MPTLLKEEKAVYNAQSAVLPLRRLAESAAAAEADAGEPLPARQCGLSGDLLHQLVIDCAEKTRRQRPCWHDPGDHRRGGDPALAGDHVHPSEEGARFAERAKDRAKDLREAQQEDLIRRTGDALYPAAGAASHPFALLPAGERGCSLTSWWLAQRETSWRRGAPGSALGCALALEISRWASLTLHKPPRCPLVHATDHEDAMQEEGSSAPGVEPAAGEHAGGAAEARP